MKDERAIITCDGKQYYVDDIKYRHRNRVLHINVSLIPVKSEVQEITIDFGSVYDLIETCNCSDSMPTPEVSRIDERNICLKCAKEIRS